MLFDFFEIFFAQELGVLRGNVATLSGKSVDKSFFFKLLVCVLGGDKADTQILRKTAYRREHIVFFELPADYLAFYLGIKIAHIEAGLRTYEARSPFPEELYRVSIDAMSDYHFAPTSAAAENLSREGRKSIYTVGNTVIDSFEYTLKNDYESPLIREADKRKILLLTTHRRENIGGKMREALLGIRDVLLSRKDLFCILPAHPNPSVRGVVEEAFCDIKNIKICEPLPVMDFHNILARSLAVLTDSGGVQEEASYLGVPVFLLRDNTERAEGRASGNIRIIGTERAGVKAQLLDVLNDREELEKMSRPTLVFGDGTASKKISEILLSNG